MTNMIETYDCSFKDFGDRIKTYKSSGVQVGCRWSVLEEPLANPLTRTLHRILVGDQTFEVEVYTKEERPLAINLRECGKRRMNNPWDLYDTHPDFPLANNAIEKAWHEAKSLAPDKPSRERARIASGHVYKVMQSWSHVGACDTEPRYVLNARIAKHFGVKVD